jgi:hypothetical protein
MVFFLSGAKVDGISVLTVKWVENALCRQNDKEPRKGFGRGGRP